MITNLIRSQRIRRVVTKWYKTQGLYWLQKNPYCTTFVLAAMELNLSRTKRLGIRQREKIRERMVAARTRPERGGEHLSKESLPPCPEQPRLWVQVRMEAEPYRGEAAPPAICSLLGGNCQEFHFQLWKVSRALPHASKARLRQSGFYMDQCKHRNSMYSKVLKKPTKNKTPQTTCWGMSTFYTCRTLIHP